MLASGLSDALDDAGVRFVDLNDAPLVRTPLRTRYTGLSELWVPKVLLDTEVVVSMPKLKTHHWVGITMSLKNCFGCMPGRVYGWPKDEEGQFLNAIALGGQYRYYLLGHFDRGLQLGLEVLLSSVSDDNNAANAIVVGPLLGGKYALPFGLTVEVQVGAGPVISGGAYQRFDPIINVQLGWSFRVSKKKRG